MRNHDSKSALLGLLSIGGALSSVLGCSSADAPSITEAPDRYFASGISLSRVEVLQALAVPIVVDGALVVSPAAPVVRGLPTQLRVAATLTGVDAARTKNIAAVAIFEDAKGARVTRISPSHAAFEYAAPSVASTWQVPLDGTEFLEGSRFRVVLVDANGGTGGTAAAQFPRDASFAAFQSEPSGSLDLMLVPIKWDVDGSGRLPDLSDKQVALYKSLFERVYPATTVTITIHEPMPVRSGSFSSINDALVTLREKENIASHFYVHGLVRPAETFAAFCRGGCTTGLGFVVDDPADGAVRVSSGTGFSGLDSAWTMAHEVGHQHGRDHAPCGVTVSDRSFPQRDGTIGLWGFDRTTPTMLDIKSHDFMSYCENEWISQYTWAGLLKRIQVVGAPRVSAKESSPQALQRVRLVHRKNGVVTFVGAPIGLRVTGSKLTESATLEGADGAHTAAMLRTIETSEDGGDAVVVPVEKVAAVRLRGVRLSLLNR